MPARPFADEYLLTYSGEHVFYEVRMMAFPAEIKSGRINPPIFSDVDVQKNIKNILVESFGLHLRNLIDFLYIDKPQETDVIAGDFLSTGTWAALRPALSSKLDSARKRANKELAHLTTNRITGSPLEKKWDILGLVGEIKVPLKKFVTNSVRTRISPRLETAIADL